MGVGAPVRLRKRVADWSQSEGVHLWYLAFNFLLSLLF